MVRSTPLTESERFATPNFHESTYHTFKNTWGIREVSPNSFAMQILFGGPCNGVDILHGARKQVETGTTQGNSFLLLKYPETRIL